MPSVPNVAAASCRRSTTAVVVGWLVAAVACGGPRGPEPAPEVDWEQLSGLDYLARRASPELEAVDGTEVRIAGFAVPLEDWATAATEFLLVPYEGACIHTPSPPPNQMVYVKMVDGEEAQLDGWAPIWVQGQLTIEPTSSYYGFSGFRIAGRWVEFYDD